MFKPCALIPVYNHPDTIASTAEAIVEKKLELVLVDDGCDTHCASILRSIADNSPQIYLKRLDQNQGKGGAVKAGLEFAKELGFSHALQIDADGQHSSSDIPRFIEMAKNNPGSLISGLPRYDASIPKLRFYARYLTHFWVWVNTLSFDIQDSMCGFRVYPIKHSVALIRSEKMGNRMDFDPEFMVRWHWKHSNIRHIPTDIGYPKDGVSHFRGLEDNWLISKMHTKLFFGMLFRLPKLLCRKLTHSNRSAESHHEQ